MERTDLVIIGGGIVGLATAFRLLQMRPSAGVAILEKEARPASHQTGHNSGVIHTGIYYAPGSLKARLCREGRARLLDLCREHDLPFELCGKLIVATSEEELPRLDALLERGKLNGVECRRLGADELRSIEPHVAGLAAAELPEAGVVDFEGVCRVLAWRIEALGGRLLTRREVRGLDARSDEIVVKTDGEEHRARMVVNCAGLHSDRVAALGGSRPAERIVPFRGEYHELVPEAAHLCRALVYPVPDPRLPFLGVHLTRGIEGVVHCGPNAVLALAREGYRRTDVTLRDALETLTFPGFLRLALRHGATGMGEIWRSLSRRALARALRRLVPEIRARHLRAAPAGVRAQLVTPDGRLFDDFKILEDERMLHVLNAPSPAATASLAIGGELAERIAKRLETP